MTQVGFGRVAIFCTIVFCATQILCVYIFARHSRFAISQSGERAFRIDRLSGEMLYIINGKYAPVEGPVTFTN